MPTTRYNLHSSSIQVIPLTCVGLQSGTLLITYMSLIRVTTFLHSGSPKGFTCLSPWEPSASSFPLDKFSLFSSHSKPGHPPSTFGGSVGGHVSSYGS